ncbi:MAG: Hsp20/alpha crystallin family protein [Ginsengibacter sp.]
MKEHLSYINEYPVYPGEYNLMPETEALLKDLKTKEHGSKPLVNMDELKDCYKIKVVIPGAMREDIFIDIDKNVLSIAVLQHDSNGGKKKLAIHEFESNNFERHIILPQNADAIFVNAEYKEGILYIYIPKAEIPVRNMSARVVVY